MSDGATFVAGIVFGLIAGFGFGIICGLSRGESVEQLREHTALCQQRGGVLQQDDTCLVGGHVGEKMP